MTEERRRSDGREPRHTRASSPSYPCPQDPSHPRCPFPSYPCLPRVSRREQHQAHAPPPHHQPGCPHSEIAAAERGNDGGAAQKRRKGTRHTRALKIRHTRARPFRHTRACHGYLAVSSTRPTRRRRHQPGCPHSEIAAAERGNDGGAAQKRRKGTPSHPCLPRVSRRAGTHAGAAHREIAAASAAMTRRDPVIPALAAGISRPPAPRQRAASRFRGGRWVGGGWCCSRRDTRGKHGYDGISCTGRTGWGSVGMTRKGRAGTTRTGVAGGCCTARL